MEDRSRVREHVLDLAHGDPRVLSGAEVGSLALGGGDRWSDIDLTFGIADGVPPTQILDDWTRDLESRFDAVRLFDLVAEPAVYRVFLLADYLQVDVSVAPASKLRPTSPRFKLLFGEVNEPEYTGAPARNYTLGWAVLWARHARICIERGERWQSEYCITHLRYNGMELACLRHDLPVYYAKGFEELPAEDVDAFKGAIVRSLDLEELLRALAHGVNGLIRESLLGSDDKGIQQRLHAMAAELELLT